MKRPSVPAGDSSKPQRASASPKPVPESADPAATARKERVQGTARQFSARLAEERRRAAWRGGLRFSTFSLVMAGVLVVGVLSLVPRIQELVVQRQQITALNADIAAAQADTKAKQTQRSQYSDPTYVQTQAREQLYFVNPGDVSYLVINDLSPAALTSAGSQQATGSVQQTQSNWMGTLLGSLWVAGNTPLTSNQPTPTPTPTGSGTQ